MPQWNGVIDGPCDRDRPPRAGADVFATAGVALLFAAAGLGVIASMLLALIAVTPAHARTITTVLSDAQSPPDDVIFHDRFEYVEPVLTIVTAALDEVHLLEAYTFTLQAAEGSPPYSWSVSGLPPGLVLDAEAGIISNDPAGPAVTRGGTHLLVIEVSDAAGISVQAELPLPVVGLSRISVGAEHTCAVSAAGRAYCWGHNDLGQLGNGEVGEFQQPNPLPTLVMDPNDPEQPLTGVVDIAASRYHTCALSEVGTAWCWGWNAAGRLGDGSENDSPVPIHVIDPDDVTRPLAGLTGLALGEIHSCASSADGHVYCWGDSFFGQIGSGSPGNHLVPSRVVDPADTTQPLTGLSGVAAGNLHTCASTATGSAWCWGWNTAGQLGNNTALPGSFPTHLPQQVVAPGDPGLPMAGVAAVSGGNVHTCALTDAGTAYCWGLGAHGQIGDGNAPANSLVPAQVVADDGSGDPLSGLVDVEGGGLHSCAVAADGRAYCWGSNEFGQLGDGSDEPASIPVPVVAPPDDFPGFARISGRGWQSCALSVEGIPYCWGDNRHGELGDGGTEVRHVPGPVRPGGIP